MDDTGVDEHDMRHTLARFARCRQNAHQALVGTEAHDALTRRVGTHATTSTMR